MVRRRPAAAVRMDSMSEWRTTRRAVQRFFPGTDEPHRFSVGNAAILHDAELPEATRPRSPSIADSGITAYQFRRTAATTRAM